MSVQYPSLTIEAGIIGAEVIDQIAEGTAAGQKATDFLLPANRLLIDEISTAWNGLCKDWVIFGSHVERLQDGDTGTTLTRDRWMNLFFYEIGFHIQGVSKAAIVDGQTFFISHRANEDPQSPPILIVGCKQSLDRRPESGRLRLAPHTLVQEYLNRSEELWGIVTNGFTLRILRDSHLTRRQAYIEFDLRKIFDEQLFSDFVLLYRLMNVTRFPKGVDDVESCYLELYHRQTIEEGSRVKDNLRDGIRSAMTIFANGFLHHPSNDNLRQRVESGDVTGIIFYQQILHLIYRFLFLMVSEERNLISGNEWYRSYYSINRLRDLVMVKGAYSHHTDLWTGLLTSFRLFSDETSGKLLAVPPLNGDLFDPKGTSVLNDLVLQNRDLLAGFWDLCMYREHQTRRRGIVKSSPWRRINYAALDVEELGSVYESLLDYQPVFTQNGTTSEFELLEGTERKSTGSYYTPPELVNELIKSALDPTIQDRLEGKKTPTEREAALLSITVCDPACGSGHFLLAAARRIGRELAKTRTGDEEPSPDAYREAIRDVITHCIYGVDKNPLAVDLCKVALWLEGHTTGKPLTFLDHRIRCGDSLIGVFDLKVLDEGIPDEAYKAVTGDDKKVATEIKKRNKKERVNQKIISFEHSTEVISSIRERMLEIDENTPEGVRAKAYAFREYQTEGTAWCKDATACHLWTAAFFAELTEEKRKIIPTTNIVWDYLSGSGVDETVKYCREIANKYKFFHWPLEFPEVFHNGGFDCILGNPPWKRVKVDEISFFSTRNKLIANAKNKSERDRLIKNLRSENNLLFKEYLKHLSNYDKSSTFIRYSNRYPLTGLGQVNNYAIFTELNKNSINSYGYCGVIVPTGIASDDTTKNFFKDIIEYGLLIKLVGFTNWNMIFPQVGDRVSFCILIISGKKIVTENPLFAFHLHQYSDINENERYFSLSYDEISKINPNTKTCPIFRNKKDVEIAKKIYENHPVLILENPANNPWDVSFMMMFSMSADSEFFLNNQEVHTVPLYEGKMFSNYNHRFGYYSDDMKDSDQRTFRNILRPTLEELKNPNFNIKPRYYVKEEKVVQRIQGIWKNKWFLVFRDIARPVDYRTGIFSIIPWSAVGNKAPIVFSNYSIKDFLLLLGNFNSIVYDYFLRQKVGGTSLNFYILKQTPIIDHKSFSVTIKDLICPRVIELTYTAWDLYSFAEDLLTDIGPSMWNEWFPNNQIIDGKSHPFIWNEERRAIIRAELDAIYAKLYGLSKEELEYILTTFPVLKKSEEKEFGEYRTGRLVMETWENIENW